MLKITGLNTYYGLSHVIQGIDLEAHPGEIVGIFGRNGVGKTTLLKTIAGWVRPRSGTITLDDEALNGLPSERIARRGVGFVPEDRRIFPGLTVEENLDLGLMQSAGRSRAEQRRAMDKTYARFPRLKERRRQLGTTLSGGEQQMLAMARVMVGGPKVVLIDEPSEGLAPMIVADIFAIIREMRQEGAIVLLVEQKVHAALEVVDRFCAVERGQITVTGRPQEEIDRTRLMDAITI